MVQLTDVNLEKNVNEIFYAALSAFLLSLHERGGGCKIGGVYFGGGALLTNKTCLNIAKPWKNMTDLTSESTRRGKKKPSITINTKKKHSRFGLISYLAGWKNSLVERPYWVGDWVTIANPVPKWQTPRRVIKKNAINGAYDQNKNRARAWRRSLPLRNIFSKLVKRSQSKKAQRHGLDAPIKQLLCCFADLEEQLKRT